jgi:prepilin-type N-terminal cleavage/methylation domain-containing protein
MNKNGFSLLETIVVCVIVAILAGISIPIYIGYVNNQRQSTVTNLVQTAAAAANANYRRTGTALTNGSITPNSDPLNLFFNGSTYTMTVSGNMIKVSETRSSPKKDSATYY